MTGWIATALLVLVLGGIFWDWIRDRFLGWNKDRAGFDDKSRPRRTPEGRQTSPGTGYTPPTGREKPQDGEQDEPGGSTPEEPNRPRRRRR